MNKKIRYYLQIADNALILSHRLSEYTSSAPFLEEDLANTNIALDLIGLAESVYEEVAKIEDKGNTADDFAYRRAEHNFYNSLLVEQPNSDFAHIIVRQFFTDAFHFYFFSKLVRSNDTFLSNLATKSLKEVTYHLRRSSEWMVRLGNGTDTSLHKLQHALNSLWKFSGDFFDESEVDKELKEKGIAADLTAIHELWRQKINEIVLLSNLKVPENKYQLTGGKEGRHTENLGHILAEMQYLPSKYPDAKW